MINGYVVFEGESRLDSAPIVLIVTGFARRSTNRKTGRVLQSYILRRDVAPLEAVRLGLDPSICGSCPHRSTASGGLGSCYVNIGHGPRAVYSCYERSGYRDSSAAECADAIRGSGLGLRVGSYGDPAAVPVSIWRQLIGAAPWHTGYSHAWRQAPDLRGLVMASVDSKIEGAEAREGGWATFRVAPRGNHTHRERKEALCPASAEAGQRVTCSSCPIKCDGQGGKLIGRVIQAHGATAGRIGAQN
jgi:hypothetical protein